MKRKNLIIGLGILFLLFVMRTTDNALAQDLSIPISDPVVIHSPDSDTYHILVKPELPLPDSDIIVKQATLNLWVDIQAKDTTYVAIDVFPILTEWDSQDVSWNFPWDNPGGDVDETVYAEYALSQPGQQEIAIDLTDICMRWFDGRLSYNGILIAVSESSIASAQFLNGQNGNGPFASMRISCSGDSQ